MTSQIKKFTDKLLKDVTDITTRMYGGSCERILRWVLSNPAVLPGMGLGDVAYQDGRCVGFQAAILRDLYLGKIRFRAIIGSTLAMAPEASPVLLMGLMKATISPRDGSKMFFANTANVKSMKMNRLLGVNGVGPVSCEKVRFSILNYGSFLRFVTHGRFPHGLALFIDFFFRLFTSGQIYENIDIVNVLNVDEMDSFWMRYLSFNQGLVSSRSGDELVWSFADGIKSGRNVMLVLRGATGIEGYIVARSADEEELRWRIADWIALQNDTRILDNLLKALIRHLRVRHQAGILEVIGFNDSVQSILRKHLPWTRKAPNNSFLWKITDAEFAETCHPNFSTDWFWGPYDGDRFMN